MSREQTLAAVASGPHGDDLRRLGIVVDLAYALVDGLFSEEVLFGGFDAIDGIEWSKWMHDHGCSAATLQSAIVRGCYDYVFARGAGGEPSAGAGTATLALLRFLLTFKGSVLYALKEPMGDCLMVPFYQVLKKRGVSFEFFCKVTALHLADDAPLIDEIVFDRQVEFQDDVSEYFPLVENPETGGWSWPNGPIASQIKDGISLAEYDLGIRVDRLDEPAPRQTDLSPFREGPRDVRRSLRCRNSRDRFRRPRSNLRRSGGPLSGYMGSIP